MAPQFEWVDQRGQQFSSSTYAVTQVSSIAATGVGAVLPLAPVLGGSVQQFGAFESGPIAGLLGFFRAPERRMR